MPAQAPYPRDIARMDEHPQTFSNAASERLLHHEHMLTIPQIGRSF